MVRVEVLRSTTTATPKIMVDRGEEHPPVYTVAQAWELWTQEKAAADCEDADDCLFCQLDNLLSLLH